MYTTFKIKEISSWSTIELTCNDRKYEFRASCINDGSFNNLLNALAIIANDNSTCAMAEFDLESEGLLRIFFTQYLYEQLYDNKYNSFIKMEVYTNIDWEQYDEEWGAQAMPVPVFESIIPYPASFAKQVIDEMERHGKEAFGCWDNEMWEEKITALKKVLR